MGDSVSTTEIVLKRLLEWYFQAHAMATHLGAGAAQAIEVFFFLWSRQHVADRYRGRMRIFSDAFWLTRTPRWTRFLKSFTYTKQFVSH